MEVTSKMLIRFITLVVFAFGFGVSGAMAADADLKKGKKVFKKCAACHTVVQKKHKIGPSLAGVMGRTAGTIEGFKYSKAMRAYGKSGIVWSEETLDAYLLNPRKAVKGTKMVFPGLKKAKDRAAVIAYLKSLNE